MVTPLVTPLLILADKTSPDHIALLLEPCHIWPEFCLVAYKAAICGQEQASIAGNLVRLEQLSGESGCAHHDVVGLVLVSVGPIKLPQ